MGFVFRPHSGNNNLDGWEDSARYDDRAIQSIQDPNGGNANIPITSIPSPFASMELVKRAFAYCADRNNTVDGTTIYHKMVSFALDILEIFFNFEKHSKEFEIIPWYRQDLNTLLTSGDDDLERLGDTLSLYLDADEDTFNFKEMDAIYMLNYINGPDPINIVGGTSPTSLTIASTNNLDYVNLFLSNNHRALNSDPDTFLSLYHRDSEFVKFVYLMSKQRGFISLYEEVNKYIQRCFATLNDIELKNELRYIDAADYDNYSSLVFGGQTTVYLAGQIAMKVRPTVDLSKSDFLINISQGKSPAYMPLVLPYNTYTEPNMRYVSGFWNSNNKAPFTDKNSMSQRTLPFDGNQYPYLTVDDVFQPSIIETIFPIASEYFFAASYKRTDKNDNRGYLIPLKRTILDFISLEDLKGYTNEPTPQPVFQLVASSKDTVKASIRIPIQKGKYITFERNYFRGMDAQPSQNKGSIVECKFNLFLFPSFHTNADFAPQRIYVIDQDSGALTRNFRYDVTAYRENENNAVPSRKIERADKSKHSYSSFYHALKREYDFLTVTNGRVENLIVPIFEDKSGGSRQFEFAVDFGTTNTHIEFTEGGGEPKPIEITSNRPFVLKLSSFSYTSQEDYKVLLNNDAEFLLKSTPQEFIPEAVSKKEDFSFPMRTNLTRLLNAKTGQRELISLADFTIAFGYEKQPIHLHNEVLTDLKWNRDNNDAVKAYIQEILLLIRNTVILNGGDLDKTTIKWFFPASMSPHLKSRLSDSWNEFCCNPQNPDEAIISPRCKVVPISESVAPYYYYKADQGVNSNTCTVVSVDVGGGTSDFVAYQNNKPEFISSVRFAGNNIFGDFYGMGSKLNGFYKIYGEKFRNKIEESSQSSDLIPIFEAIVENGNTSDLISFLFSLDSNVALKKSGESISLSKELQDNYQLRIVFLLFYAAIMYYIAKLLAKKGIPAPGYITCSGTASKIFNIIGSSDNIQKFTKVLFDKLQKSENKLVLKQVMNPKEITCKGGLKMSQIDIDSTPGKQYYFGAAILDDDNNLIRTEALRQMSKDLMNQVVSGYKEFIKFFFSLNKEFSFAQYFGIEDNGVFKRFESVLTEFADQDFSTVLEERLKDFEDSDGFEDSLFFYPLTGGIFRLAQYISDNQF